jgi:DNA polymerase-3 subunit beta
MKFTVLKERLEEGVKALKSAVGLDRGHDWRTESIVLENTGKSLKLSAMGSFGLLWATTVIASKNERDGKAVLPYKTLADWVKKLPESRVEFEWNDETSMMTIIAEETTRTGSTPVKAQIKGYSGDPVIWPTFVPTQSFEIWSRDLKAGIEHVETCAATEENRPILQGVNIQSDAMGYVFAAADGYRLGVCAADYPEEANDEVDVNITIHADHLGSVVDMIDGYSEGLVQVDIDNKHDVVKFNLPGGVVMATILSGTFPDYKSTLISNNKSLNGHYEVIVPADDFFGAVKRAGVFARDNANSCMMIVSHFDPTATTRLFTWLCLW